MRPEICLALIFFIATAVHGQKKADTNFLKTKGTWISPIDKIVEIDTMRESSYEGEFGDRIIIKTDSARWVHFVQPGEVVLVTTIGSCYAIITRTNDYFITYSCFKSVLVKKGDMVGAGQIMGQLMKYDKDVFELEIGIYKEKMKIHMLDWFTEAFRNKARTIK